MTAIIESGALETRGALTGRELTAWLESPDGEAWSRAWHQAADRYSHGVFAEIKNDHPATCPGDGSDIDLGNRSGPEILTETAWYGMTGIAREADWRDSGLW